MTTVCDENGTSGLWFFLPQNHNPCLNMRKTSDISQEILQNTQPGLLREVKVIRNKESLRNGSSQEGPKEKRQFQVSGIWGEGEGFPTEGAVGLGREETHSRSRRVS